MYWRRDGQRARGADEVAAPGRGGVAGVPGKATLVGTAPGAYQPDTPEGQLLIAHEVVHLVQQADGRVDANASIDGRAVNTDRGLEGEADELAARALRGERLRTSAPALRPAGGPIQGKF